MRVSERSTCPLRRVTSWDVTEVAWDGLANAGPTPAGSTGPSAATLTCNARRGAGCGAASGGSDRSKPVTNPEYPCTNSWTRTHTHTHRTDGHGYALARDGRAARLPHLQRDEVSPVGAEARDNVPRLRQRIRSAPQYRGKILGSDATVLVHVELVKHGRDSLDGHGRGGGDTRQGGPPWFGPSGPAVPQFPDVLYVFKTIRFFV